MEQHRDKELSERREKRRKLAAEEQARKDKKNGSVSEVCAALDQIQSAAVTAVSGVADSSLVWTSNRTTTLQVRMSEKFYVYCLVGHGRAPDRFESTYCNFFQKRLKVVGPCVHARKIER